MGRIVTALLIVGCVSVSMAASQARGGAGGPSLIKACSMLTRDLVLPFAENPKVLDLVPPEEEVIGTYGTACEYGIVRLQLYSVRPGDARTAPKEFQALPGVGETAYFRNNRNNYAELMVWNGTHHFTLQVSVPTGSTAEAIKPKTIVLANTLIAKLK